MSDYIQEQGAAASSNSRREERKICLLYTSDAADD